VLLASPRHRPLTHADAVQVRPLETSPARDRPIPFDTTYQQRNKLKLAADIKAGRRAGTTPSFTTPTHAVWPYTTSTMAGKMRWGDSAELDDDEAEFEVALPAQQVSSWHWDWQPRTFVPLQAKRRGTGGLGERESGTTPHPRGWTRRRDGRPQNERTAAS
jgi:hypothetical protein